MLAFDPDILKNFSNFWLTVHFNLWRYWEKIECPVLILRGKESDFLTQALVDRMISSLPHAELVEFDGVGHIPTLNAAEQQSIVLDWLDATPVS